jgi:hypothetical protein
MLSEFWLAPNLFPIRHSRRTIVTFKAVPSTPASICLGHGLCEGLKVKGRADIGLNRSAGLADWGDRSGKVYIPALSLSNPL